MATQEQVTVETLSESVGVGNSSEAMPVLMCNGKFGSENEKMERQQVTNPNSTLFALLAANDGDMSGLANLYSHHSRVLHRIALSIVNDQDDAHDVVIDVFLKICELPKSRLPSTNGPAWLRTLARNRAIDFLRKSKCSVLTENLDAICPDSSRDESERIELQMLLGHLDALSRKIVVEKVVNGRTHQEIGRMLTMSKSSVWRRYQKALKSLKTILQSHAFSG